MELTRCGTRGVNARTSSWDVFGATMRETNHETYDEEELVTNEGSFFQVVFHPRCSKKKKKIWQRF